MRIDMIRYKKVLSNFRRSSRIRVSPANSEFYKDLRPLLAVLRALGTIPYYISPNGEISFKFLHPVSFYSFAVQIIITMIAVVREEQTLSKMDNGSMDFRSRMMEYTAVVFYLPCFLVPVISWPETLWKLRFVNAWARFEAEYIIVTGKPLELQMRGRVRMAMGVSTAYVVVQILLVIWRFRISAWWMVPAVMSCSLFIAMLPNLWIACCWELQRGAFLLGREMELILVYGLERGVRLSQYRVLWLRLSRLTRGLGDCMTLSVGTFMVTQFALIALFMYYMLLSVANGEGYRILHMVLLLAFNLFCVYLLCSSAQTAVEQLDVIFRDRLERLQVLFECKHHAAEYELEKFLNTIRRHKPVISFRGFVNIDRRLQTSRGKERHVNGIHQVYKLTVTTEIPLQGKVIIICSSSEPINLLQLSCKNVHNVEDVWYSPWEY